MATISEQEKKNILERITLGKKLAIARGVKMGRPTGTAEATVLFLKKPKIVEIQKLINNAKKNYTYMEMAKIGKCSPNLIAKIIKLLNPDRDKYIKIEKIVEKI